MLEQHRQGKDGSILPLFGELTTVTSNGTYLGDVDDDGDPVVGRWWDDTET